MMPQHEQSTISNSATYSSTKQSSSASQITSKVQTNTYACSTSQNNVHQISVPRVTISPEHPECSSLKANIDELDNILTDLNNSIASGLNSKAQTMSPSPRPMPKTDKYSRCSASPRPLSPSIEYKVMKILLIF